MKKQSSRTILSLLLVTSLAFVGCSSKPSPNPPSTPTLQESLDTITPTEPSPTVVPSTLTYKMEEYTDVPNDKSDVKIQYPVFSGENSDTINNMIKSRVESYVTNVSEFFNNELGVTFDYQTDITLLNSKFLSMIIWGSSYIEGGAHPNDDLKVFNLNLQTLEEVSLHDLYRIGDEFESIFFEKSYYPTAPETSYDAETFVEMRNLQSKEYLSISPFQVDNNVNFFLKSDGIVLTMPAVHATGSDHFEAQLNYDHIQSHYIPENDYWID